MFIKKNIGLIIIIGGTIISTVPSFILNNNDTRTNKTNVKKYY
jgi:hypothetical protein